MVVDCPECERPMGFSSFADVILCIDCEREYVMRQIIARPVKGGAIPDDLVDAITELWKSGVPVPVPIEWVREQGEII